MKIKLIGLKHDTVTNVKETLAQIEKLKKLKLDLVDEEGMPINWKKIDDHNNKRTILQAILVDRKKRVNKKIPMADRPNFTVFTIEDKRIIRLEYYAGHDELELVYDIRAKDFKDKPMENYLSIDEYSYDRNNEFADIPDFGMRKMLQEGMDAAHERLNNINHPNYLVRPTITMEEHSIQITEYLFNRIADGLENAI